MSGRPHKFNTQKVRDAARRVIIEDMRKSGQVVETESGDPDVSKAMGIMDKIRVMQAMGKQGSIDMKEFEWAKSILEGRVY